MKRLAILFVLGSFLSAGAYAQIPKFVNYKVGDASFKMVEIPGGSFLMGATENFASDSEDNEKPVHRVTLHSFAIGETEVSQELWMAVMGDNPSLFQDSRDLPVESVTYNDCLKFISRLNSLTGKRFRLPTEAEWEYAARGGNSNEGVYCGRSGPGYCEASSPRAISTYSNNWDICAMSGNVREWCSDWMGRYPTSAQTNPAGPSSGTEKVCRGGGWGDPRWRCRSTSREGVPPDYSSGDLGFRLAMDVNLDGTIVGYPEVMNIKSEKEGVSLVLCSVGLYKDETVLDFSVKRDKKSTFYMIQSTTLYSLEIGPRYRLKGVSGMYGPDRGLYRAEIGPKETHISLSFEPVPSDTRFLNWASDEWLFEGILLTSDAPRVLASQKKEVPAVSSEVFPLSAIDVKPRFNGGEANQFSSWVSSRLVYPDESRKNGSAGRVMVGFTIKTDGTVQNVRVVRSSGDELLDAEAVRVVGTSPKWSPGLKDGKPVNVSFTFPVVFALN